MTLINTVKHAISLTDTAAQKHKPTFSYSNTMTRIDTVTLANTGRYNTLKCVNTLLDTVTS